MNIILNPPHDPVLVDGLPLAVCDELEISVVYFNSKLTFGQCVKCLVSSASGKLGIMRKAHRTFGEQFTSVSYFRSFILPVLEHCSPVCH